MDMKALVWSGQRTRANWLLELPTIALLLLVLVIGTGEMVHGQLLRLGERVFGDTTQQVQYFMLRADPVKPLCEARADAPDAVPTPLVSPQDSDIDALFDSAPASAADRRQAQQQALEVCQQKHALYQRLLTHHTFAVVAYRTLEISFQGLFHFGAEHRPLILLALLGVTMLSATLGYHHLSLVAPRFGRDYRLQALSMAIASALALWSSLRYRQIVQGNGLDLENPSWHLAWGLIFTVLLLVSLWQLTHPREGRDGAGPGTWGHACKALPLGNLMMVVAGAYFWRHEHPAGLAIYINTLMDLPNLPLQLALFIWAGMLFKQTRIVDLFMNLLRPWRLSPEVLTYLILLGAAIPTANTGGSGAFVMAAGAIIYHEVRAVGGSSQFALAASAMSGSLGVVLRPCLLIVAIVAVNRQVTTDELYHWGIWVFFLTSSLFFLASQWRREERGMQMATPSRALPAMLRELPPLLPYVALALAVAMFYDLVLDTPLNEISAPTIMPIMMLLVVVMDKWLQRRAPASAAPSPFSLPREARAGDAVRVATGETVSHLGGYLFLIVMSQAIGGVIERSELIELAPATFDSAWTAMAFMATALVLLGMVMEPLGAVFLVSGTFAPLAYRSGIDPVHFWMMVLVAFELGYLMPPVALNQLLARQVVGDALIEAADREVAHRSFYRRYERWILPCAVMTVGLLIVAFAPLALRSWPELHQALQAWLGPRPH